MPFKKTYQIQGKQLRQQIWDHHRDPFKEVLVDLLQNRPSGLALKRLANEPESWARTVNTIGQLSGYHPKVEHDVKGTIHHIHAMSDLELQAAYEDMQRELEQLKAIEGEIVDEDDEDAA